MGVVNRWWIAVASVTMQMALGGFYSWSVFRIPLSTQFGWTISQVTVIFTINTLGLGFGSFLAGLLLNRKGPRLVAWLGGFLWGSGVFLASLSAHRLWWLYLSYGVIGGNGLGFCYIVPLGVLVKWFPEHRGLVTGLAVGGVGAGSLVVAPVATRLIQTAGVLPTFAYLGVAYFIVIVLAGSFMRNPPVGWKPEGWIPTAAQISQRAARDYSLGETVKTWQFWTLCLLFCLNSIAGISLISQAAPIFEEMGRMTAIAAGGMVGIVSIANGGGRLFWGWVSDVATRKATLFFMFLIQAVLFWIFPNLTSATFLGIAAFVIVLCYGGGFGIMPAFAADYFGPRNVGSIYGLMFIPWSFAAAFGPLAFAYLRQVTGSYGRALYIIAGVMAVSTVLPGILFPPSSRNQLEGPQAGPAVGPGIAGKQDSPK
jgi:OFA family oxalate/formate antiporter-like MFS transporter